MAKTPGAKIEISEMYNFSTEIYSSFYYALISQKSEAFNSLKDFDRGCNGRLGRSAPCYADPF